MAVSLSALRTGHALLCRNIIFLLSEPQGLLRLDRSGKLEEIHSFHRIWNPLPSGLQPSALATTLPRGPQPFVSPDTTLALPTWRGFRSSGCEASHVRRLEEQYNRTVQEWLHSLARRGECTIQGRIATWALPFLKTFDAF
jgi:hypothetical protein